eukprot:855603-Pleurochrysis_carterae.AAC.1
MLLVQAAAEVMHDGNHAAGAGSSCAANESVAEVVGELKTRRAILGESALGRNAMGQAPGCENSLHGAAAPLLPQAPATAQIHGQVR